MAGTKPANYGMNYDDKTFDMEQKNKTKTKTCDHKDGKKRKL